MFYHLLGRVLLRVNDHDASRYNICCDGLYVHPAHVNALGVVSPYSSMGFIVTVILCEDTVIAVSNE